MVSSLVMSGYTVREIAESLDLGETTVLTHFPKELKIGRRVANARVVQSLFKNAISGNVTAQIFWCKTQLHWREVNTVELTGLDGQPLFQGIISSEPLSMEEWIVEYGTDNNTRRIEANTSSLETTTRATESAD